MGTPQSIPWAVWAVVLPLAGACLALLVGRRGRAWVGLLTVPAVAAAASGVAWQVWHHGPQRYPLGGWGAPLGIDLYADGLSALMLLMTAGVAVPVSVYALEYFADHEGATHGAAGEYFWPLWLFQWGTLNALFLSADVFNLYVTLELLTLSAVALVGLAGAPAALTAATRYLLAAVLGSLAYLLGVGLLYAAHGTLDLTSLARALAPGPLATAAVTLITVGLLVKTALFPLHFWLPPAHANAPAPVSAVLSALVVKASFYLLLRLWFQVFPAALSSLSGEILAALGAAAVVWGSLQALLARRLKRLVAYSTVAQVGYLFLLFALTGPGTGMPTGWGGGVYFALAHACAKAALFLAAGNVLFAVGHDRIDRLGGVGQRLPVTFLTMGMAAVTLLGLPPSGGFAAKWLLLQAAIRGGQVWVVAVLLAGGLLAAGYLFRVLQRAFVSPPSGSPRSVPRVMDWAAMALALAGLALGFVAAPALELLQIGSPWAGPTDPEVRP